MNKKLTAANEKSVMALIQDNEAKAAWQAEKSFGTVANADRVIAKRNGVSINTVKAARYYW